MTGTQALLFLYFVLFVVIMYMGITSVMKSCGELMCSAYELCMPHDMQCYPCDSYCDKKSHNFDRNYCQNQCQDYIREKMQADDGGAMGYFNVHSLFLVLCLAIVAFVFVLLKINKFMERSDGNPEVVHDNLTTVNSEKASLGSIVITSVISKNNEGNKLPCEDDSVV